MDKSVRFPAQPIRVSILRFDPMRAAGLEAIFNDNAGIDIVVEPSADQVGSGWLDPNVRVVVVGSRLGSRTLKLITSIRTARPDLDILVMSPAAGDEAILRVLRLGAKGFLHEAVSGGEFEAAVRTVASGSIWAPRRLLAELIRRLLASHIPKPSLANVELTVRERQVLNLLLDGQSNKEIAKNLKIEERTVKSYVTKLLRKMNVKNRTALSMLAMAGK